MKIKNKNTVRDQSLVAALLIAASSGVWAQGGFFDGRVVGVTDGDTITVLDAVNRPHEIRLAGIDAPETSCHARKPSYYDDQCVDTGQEFGKASKRNLSNLVYNQDVRVKVLEGSTYGREIGYVFSGDVDINYEQVKSGYAWHYKKYASLTQTNGQFDLYSKAEMSAREEKIGLWSSKHPVEPWNYRISQRSGSNFALRN